MKARALIALVIVLLAGVVATADTMELPHLVLRSGALAHAIPFFDAAVYLAGTYAGEGFESHARGILTVVPGLGYFQEIGVRFFPGEMTMGAEAGFTLIPFHLATADIFAETAVFETYVGDADVKAIGIAGAEMWFGSVFGGRFYWRMIGDFPGESRLSATSITSATYDQFRGFGLEEEVDLRVRFDAPNFFGGQLLTDGDLTSLVAWANARVRLDANGFGVGGIEVGFEVEIRSPLDR